MGDTSVSLLETSDGIVLDLSESHLSIEDLNRLAEEIEVRELSGKLWYSTSDTEL